VNHAEPLHQLHSTSHLFGVDINVALRGLPSARAIVVRRDPRDTLLSIYMNVFAAGSHLCKHPAWLAVTHKWCGVLIHLPELPLATASRS
jgi:hypothetical protein